MSLRLTGELDIASVAVLEDRLSQLRLHASGLTVRLDLSRLAFIDSRGLHTLIRAMNYANTDGWHLRIDEDMAPQVERLLRLVGLEGRIRGYDSEGH